MYKNIDFFKKMKEEGKTLQEVSQMCNVSTKTITNWEKRFDIKLSRSNTRKYYFDEEYFLNIDNEEKAYFLGLIMADGYINKENRTLVVTLKNEDSYILEQLLKSAGSNNTLKNKKNNTQKSAILCSKKMVNILNEKFSLYPNKTYNLKFPVLKEELMRHFLRGYFDGDGYIGERQCSLIIASECFLNGVLSFYKKVFNKDIYVEEFEHYYNLRFNKKDRDIIKYMYEDSNIFLKRKKERYEKYWSAL